MTPLIQVFTLQAGVSEWMLVNLIIVKTVIYMDNFVLSLRARFSECRDKYL